MWRLLVPFLCVSYTYAQQKSQGCLLMADQNPRYFRVNAGFQGDRVFPCPTNTFFNQNMCGCVWVDNPVNPSPSDLADKARRDRLNNMGGMNTNNMNNMNNMNMNNMNNLNNMNMNNMNNMNNMGNMGGGGGAQFVTEPISTTRPPCNLQANPDRHKYNEFILGFDWMERSCPMGTLFSQEACACHELDPNQKYTCRPELWLKFNERDIVDSAGYHISVGNNGNVENVSNAGKFDGTGLLTVWQYARQDLGSELTVTLRIFEYAGGRSDEQVLISNCFAQFLGSIEIAINQQSQEIIFRVEAQVGKFPEGVELRIPYAKGDWKTVTLMYDGNMVTGIVDQEIKTAPLKGDITLRDSGFLVGSCNGRGFVGYIDDLRLYRCLVAGIRPIITNGANPAALGPVSRGPVMTGGLAGPGLEPAARSVNTVNTVNTMNTVGNNVIDTGNNANSVNAINSQNTVNRMNTIL